MDWDFISRFVPVFAQAAILTITLSFFGILFSLLIGLACSVIQYFKIPVLRRIVGIYIELSRNTPLLVQLFFLYFGLPKLGIVLSSEACAIVGLSFLGGSYMAEAFRSGLESVEQHQRESALSIGMSFGQVVRYIVFPQAISISIPVIFSNIIFLIKETSVFSAVALADLMFVAKDIIGIYYKTDEALLMLVLSYLMLLLPLSLIAHLLERRVRHAGFGHSCFIGGQ